MPLASARSAGKKVPYGDGQLEVRALADDAIEGFDIAIFSAGGGVSREWAPKFRDAGCVVVDNSSAWRMEPNVPLVVAEVNGDALERHEGIVANPNCSTMQMVMALKPILDAVGIERVIVSTYQSTSGTGQKAVEELRTQAEAVLGERDVEAAVYPHQIAFNILPQVETFKDGDDYTTEERKMMAETRKILGADDIAISATCVRVPVYNAHSESVNVQTREDLSPERCREVLSAFPGVVVVDDPAAGRYPMPIDAAGHDEVFVGRIRRDPSHERCLNLWIVGDNLRKGAATNAVQVAEQLVAAEPGRRRGCEPIRRLTRALIARLRAAVAGTAGPCRRCPPLRATRTPRPSAPTRSCSRGSRGRTRRRRSSCTRSIATGSSSARSPSRVSRTSGCSRARPTSTSCVRSAPTARAPTRRRRASPRRRRARSRSGPTCSSSPRPARPWCGRHTTPPPRRSAFGPAGGPARRSSQRDATLTRRHCRAASAALAPSTTYEYRWESDGKLGDVARFTTPPASPDDFSFGVIGDYGIGTPAARANLRRLSEDPRLSFAITTGDNAQIYGSEEEYRSFVLGPLRRLIGTKPFWPSVGNHDYYNLQNYKRFFATPGGKLYYSFTYGGVLFLSLDSNRFDGAQRRWLRNELSTSQARCKVAYFHHPLWSSGRGYGGHTGTCGAAASFRSCSAAASTWCSTATCRTTSARSRCAPAGAAARASSTS